MENSRGLRLVVLFTMFYFLFSILPAKAQKTVQGEHATALDSAFTFIYQLRLQSATRLVNAQVKQHPNDPVWTMMMVNLAWAYLVTGYMDDERWNTVFDGYIVKTEKLVAQTKHTNNEHLFLYMLCKAFTTRKDVMLDNYMSAVLNLNTCIGLVSKSFGKEQEYAPFYLTSGLYYYAMQEAYDDYLILRPYLLLYPSGDKEKGREYLVRASRDGDLFMRTEATYFLMRIDFDMEQDHKQALVYANALLATFPDNVIFRYFAIQSLEKMGRKTEAEVHHKAFARALEQNPELTPLQKEFLRKSG